MRKLNGKFWFSLVLFGLIGQITWTMENMFLNVYIYNIFNASANDISLMVSASAIVATITTILFGAISDKAGKRKIFICLGYILWGISLLFFTFISKETMMKYTSDIQNVGRLCILGVIALDCIMTFFGSASNDACFNAWIADKGHYNARGAIEGLNAIMPILSLLIVFGSFMFLDLKDITHWNLVFKVLGLMSIASGLIGMISIEDSIIENNQSFKDLLFHSFKKDVVKGNKMLYMNLVLISLFCISVQIFMPYLILYYEYTLQLTNYVVIFAPAVIIAAIFTVFYSKIYDIAGFSIAIIPSTIILILSYIILFISKSTVPVFIGTLLMMMGYLSGLSIYGASIKDRIPEHHSGQYQGVRIIFQVLIPGVIGPMISSFILASAKTVLNNDGTYSFLPDSRLFVASLLIMVILCLVLAYTFKMIRTAHYDLYTKQGEKKEGWDSYPRMQLKREGYMLLNGIWKLNNHDIKVPYPPQSLLSEYKGDIGDELVYEKTFMIPDHFNKDRIIIHFEAVDQICDLYINEQYVGHHEGGYLRFSFDITQYINRDKENYLRLQVTDTLSHVYPYGKQTKKRGGMWYTEVSGIYKPVWLENVSHHYIEDLRITPDLKGIDLEVIGDVGECNVMIYDNNECVVNTIFTRNTRIDIENPKLWTCETPHLYKMKIITKEDSVESYFALRTISIKEVNGIQRVLLNDQPIFMHGVLDQGYFSDGLYIGANEMSYDEDILRMKELGFNMLRKHIKVEPDYFYYACDKHGMLVMQDMVNNGSYSFIFDTVIPTYISKKRDDTKKDINSKTSQFFIQHSLDTLKQLYNHPCIISYCIFNEGWGQFQSDKVFEIIKNADPTRLYDSTSGWFHQNYNDFDSEHIYFKKIELIPETRPYFVSECGGFTMKCENHIYSQYNVYGYGVCENSDLLTDKIEDLYRDMIIPGIKKGVCGCIYTQLSDVEDEINGLYTYDRKICKVNIDQMIEIRKEIDDQINNI